MKRPSPHNIPTSKDYGRLPPHIQVNGKRPFPPTIKQPTMIDGRSSPHIQVNNKRPSSHNKSTSEGYGRPSSHIQVNSKRPFPPQQTNNRQIRFNKL
ncbi:MAG: hypothetical protein GY803_31170 [Chloroflexi bacterium]|nr:hypothetical protein [Chloroflexota bacterium]